MPIFQQWSEMSFVILVKVFGASPALEYDVFPPEVEKPVVHPHYWDVAAC